jgi:hypothetical protein
MSLSPKVRAELIKKAPAAVRLNVEKRFRVAFQKMKNEMIADFMNHPVTIEINGGITARNISDTLNGITNLFSFIGFEKGTDPIKDIQDLLYETDFEFVRTTSNSIEFIVNIPDAKEIFDATPMPWSPGRSWVKGIESGISGLGYYLKTERETSRSGLGIQSPRQVRKKGVKFKNTAYISQFLKEYRKKFKDIKI